MPQLSLPKAICAPTPTSFIMSHPGELCQAIREARHVSQADIAAFCQVNSSTISRFEHDGTRLSRETYRRYVAALSSPALVALPHQRLSPARQRMLLELYCHAIHQAEALDHYACINFAILAEAKTNEQADLIHVFAQEVRPAFITDDLGFIHVINGSMRSLFALTPNDSFLSSWEAWHTLAMNVRPATPIRRAYPGSIELVMPALLASFIEDERSHPYFFTPQLQCLHRRLQHIMIDHDLTEHLIHWHDALSMRGRDAAQPPAVLIRLDNDEIGMFQPQTQMVRTVRGPRGRRLRFSMTTLDPVNRIARQFLPAIPSGGLSFAAHYDTGETMHVNTWPEVGPLLER